MVTPPVIKTFSNTRFIGMSMEMSIAQDRTGDLFRRFMPRRKEVAMDDLTYDVRIFPKRFYDAFSPTNLFTKWACVRTEDSMNIPQDMEPLTIDEGIYAVFKYRGSDGSAIFNSIFQDWLPASGFELDDRPHFDILGPKTKLNDPTSEEEIWIPVLQS